MPAHLVLFPESYLALNREVAHHPLLLQRLSKHPQSETETLLAEIAAYCGIAVDGEFTQKELGDLAHICWEKLKTMRPKSAIHLPGDDFGKFLNIH